jgi:hypothetical protein
MSVTINDHSSLDFVLDVYRQEGCGICEKRPGAEVFWCSPFSRFVHQKCFLQIDASETMLTKTIDSFFLSDKNHLRQNMSHVEAIRAVRSSCGKPIAEFVEDNGLEALTELMNSVGVEAVNCYSATLGE